VYVNWLIIMYNISRWVHSHIYRKQRSLPSLGIFDHHEIVDTFIKIVDDITFFDK